MFSRNIYETHIVSISGGKISWSSDLEVSISKPGSYGNILSFVELNFVLLLFGGTHLASIFVYQRVSDKTHKAYFLLYTFLILQNVRLLKSGT
jgi:hypothetical protein